METILSWVARYPAYWMLFSLALFAVSVSSLLKGRRRKQISNEAATAAAEVGAKFQKLRDHDLNTGRQIFNLLSAWAEKSGFDLRITKIEDNGGRYSIICYTGTCFNDSNGVPILQINIRHAIAGTSTSENPADHMPISVSEGPYGMTWYTSERSADTTHLVDRLKNYLASRCQISA